MHRLIDQEKLTDFLGVMMPEMNEMQRRHLLAALSEMLGRGSIPVLSEITDVSSVTISKGRKEIAEVERDAKARPSAKGNGRIRSEGGGRTAAHKAQPGLDEALESLMEGYTVGNPENPLRWTTKSTRRLSAELKGKGYDISYVTVGKRLKEIGYSLQQNKKFTEAGDPGPDRDAQFRFISEQTSMFLLFGCPVISVDAKKKELVGNYKNAGSEYRPKGEPRLVNDHDFEGGLGKAVPYGIYDIGRDEGYVNVGISADTAEFAVNSIRSWWTMMGSDAYPEAKMLMITADCGGSNGRRNRLWKKELQNLADETGLTIFVRHFPPGTSKWNKIEHRLFSFISMNWRGRPLEDYAVIVNLISGTSSRTGLSVKCDLDRNEYVKGIRISDEEMEGLNITKDTWHGEWNYAIAPREKS